MKRRIKTLEEQASEVDAWAPWDVLEAICNNDADKLKRALGDKVDPVNPTTVAPIHHNAYLYTHQVLSSFLLLFCFVCHPKE